MIKSMTGYGKYSHEYGDIRILCELKSLNGKFTDVRIKSTIALGEKELEVRNLILDKVKRGKIEANISLEGDVPMSGVSFDIALINHLFEQLEPVFIKNGQDQANILPAIIRMPHVLQNQTSDISKELWKEIEATILKGIKKFDEFRANEGQSIREDLENSVQLIAKNLAEIDPYDEDRQKSLRERLSQKMSEYLSNESVDQNRFEQEVLYYLEKIDINEEKVRLNQHCEHFIEVMNAEGDEKGKKLSFISQEMGREINTMGSKAQWTAIQKHVVEMKNELEKIKEQLANTV